MILVAKNIHKSYADLHILKGIDFSVAKGEIVAIVGSSGAGKTTLLQILGTLDTPDQGTLEIDGINPFTLNGKKLSAFRNQEISFIFQFHQLLPEFTAVENVMLPALIKGVRMEVARKEALVLLERLGLKERADHKPSELSGGEQQRTAVCRALINKPKIIFADEPSGNLDSQNAAELHALFIQLRDEFDQTVIIVTHNDSLARMADRMLTMRDGTFVSND
jgi:lipoprotein-releasing system ATP-binding protein